MADYIDKGAILSKCGRYRYLLWREWRGTHKRENWAWANSVDGNGKQWGQPKPCVFVMLNPSTANAKVDDPTIRRCVAYAKAWQYERLEVVNLFAYRATSPHIIFKHTHNDDPVGVDNQRYIQNATHEAGVIVCAWGAHGTYLGQDQTVLGWINRPTFALGLTKAGHPRHPLYTKANAPLIPMGG